MCDAFFSATVLVAVLFTGFNVAVQGQDTTPAAYDEHVAVIFRQHCLQCHGDAKQEAGLNLSSYSSIIKGGSGGAVVVPGRSNASLLFSAITAEDPGERMPPKNDALPKDQLAIIKSWIDGGLRENIGSKVTLPQKMAFVPSPIVEGSDPFVVPESWPDIQHAKTVRSFPILAMAASPRASLLAVAAYERVEFVEPSTRKVLAAVAFPEGEPHVLRFNRSGSVLMAAGGRPVQNGVVVLFDVRTGKRLAEIGNESDVVLAADLSSDERRVAMGGSSRSVKVFSTTDGSLVQTLVKHTDWITAIAYSPDGKLLATGDRSGNIHLWDADSGGVILPLSEHKASVTALTWRSDSQILASSGEDGQIIWWEVAKGWPVVTKPDAHPPVRPAGVYGKIANGILDASFMANGNLLTCGRDRSVRLWSGDGSLLKLYDLGSDSPRNASSSGIRLLPLRTVATFDGKTILCGDSAGQLHAWNADGDK